MNVVIADNPPRLHVPTGRFHLECEEDLKRGKVETGVHCRGCYMPATPLWGDGAALAALYVENAHGRGDFGRAEAARVALADWLDENAADLTLPEHLRYAVGAAVRDGCPDAATAKPLEV